MQPFNAPKYDVSDWDRQQHQDAVAHAKRGHAHIPSPDEIWRNARLIRIVNAFIGTPSSSSSDYSDGVDIRGVSETKAHMEIPAGHAVASQSSKEFGG